MKHYGNAEGTGVNKLSGKSVEGEDLALTLESSRFNSRLYQVADALWPLSVAFMLVIGGVVARARVWSGWRRWTPVLCGAALPLLFGVQAVAGRKAAAVVFGIYTTAAWGLLGWAVLTSRERSQL